MDGILNINKPRGMTSFGVVALVKRLTGERHTGHAGTLDPEAAGVLPVCLGQATRVIEFLFTETKTYRTEIELGVTTDTYDATGKVVGVKDASGINREMVEEALARFRGPIIQIPPMFSAVKHRGKPLYKLARSGVQVERKGRQAQIFSLEIVDWQPPAVTLNVVCGKGTYIRSLANDLGEVLGCGANMKSLIRLRVGPFSIEDAMAISQLEEISRHDDWQPHLYPLDYVLMDFPALVVKREQQCKLVHGASFALTMDIESSAWAEPCGLFRVYNEEGSFLGLVRYDIENRLWQPEKIFIRRCCEH